MRVKKQIFYFVLFAGFFLAFNFGEISAQTENDEHTSIEIDLSDSVSTEGSYDEEGQIQSPLKQVQSGVSAQDVVCREGLQLIIKTSNNSPACVSASTAAALVERGWAN